MEGRLGRVRYPGTAPAIVVRGGPGDRIPGAKRRALPSAPAAQDRPVTGPSGRALAALAHVPVGRDTGKHCRPGRRESQRGLSGHWGPPRWFSLSSPSVKDGGGVRDRLRNNRFRMGGIAFPGHGDAKTWHHPILRIHTGRILLPPDLHSENTRDRPDLA